MRILMYTTWKVGSTTLIMAESLSDGLVLTVLFLHAELQLFVVDEWGQPNPRHVRSLTWSIAT